MKVNPRKINNYRRDARHIANSSFSINHFFNFELLFITTLNNYFGAHLNGIKTAHWPVKIGIKIREPTITFSGRLNPSNPIPRQEHAAQIMASIERVIISCDA